jgi:HSP90 family molecular chaperone
MEPPDKLPMPDTACDKMVLCAQPFRTRKPNEYEKGEYGKFYGSTADNMIGPMTQIHYIAENKVTFKSLIFDPDNQPLEQFNKHRQATEMIKLHIRRVFVTNDFADRMPSDYNFVQNVLESDDPPLNVSRSKGEQGRQLEALTEGVHDVHHQKFTLSNHEITSPVNATYKSIAMGEQNHRVKACLIKKAVEETIMFDEAHKGDVSKLYTEVIPGWWLVFHGSEER